MENREFNPVGWFEIYVNDMERAKIFYENVFNITMDNLPSPDDNDPMQMCSFPSEINNPGSGGALVKMEGFSAGSNSTIVYFVCEDCGVEEKRIASAGGKVFKSKMSIGDYGFIVLGTDTEGNMFGLHSMK